jgi:hypothetical protein
MLVFRYIFSFVFWVAFLNQRLDLLQVAELKGTNRKFKEDFGRKRKRMKKYRKEKKSMEG